MHPAGLITLLFTIFMSYTSDAFGVTGTYHPTTDEGDEATAIVSSFQPFVTMEDYVQACGDYQQINQNLARQRLSKLWQRCYSYTAATLATLYDLERTAPIKQLCVPSNVSPEYAMDQSIKYARKEPETLEDNPARIILEALAVRYPC
jgi:hypothetical protein